MVSYVKFNVRYDRDVDVAFSFVEDITDASPPISDTDYAESIVANETFVVIDLNSNMEPIGVELLDAVRIFRGVPEEFIVKYNRGSRYDISAIIEGQQVFLGSATI